MSVYLIIYRTYETASQQGPGVIFQQKPAKNLNPITPSGLYILLIWPMLIEGAITKNKSEKG